MREWMKTIPDKLKEHQVSKDCHWVVQDSSSVRMCNLLRKCMLSECELLCVGVYVLGGTFQAMARLVDSDFFHKAIEAVLTYSLSVISQLLGFKL